MNANHWLEQARRARRTGDLYACLSHATAAVADAWSEHAPEVAYHAHACVGRVHLSRAEPREALSCFREAMDVVRRHSLQQWLAPAYHDLYIASKEAGEPDARNTWGAEAFYGYHDRNPRAPQITGLLADFADELLSMNPGCLDAARHAKNAWRAVPVSMEHPRFHMAAASNMMYASALLGLASRFEAAAVALDYIFERLPHHEHAARDLAHGAHAATIIRDYPRAASLALGAITVAERRVETTVRQWAREVLDAARAERVAMLPC